MRPWNIKKSVHFLEGLLPDLFQRFLCKRVALQFCRLVRLFLRQSLGSKPLDEVVPPSWNPSVLYVSFNRVNTNPMKHYSRESTSSQLNDSFCPSYLACHWQTVDIGKVSDSMASWFALTGWTFGHVRVTALLLRLAAFIRPTLRRNFRLSWRLLVAL